MTPIDQFERSLPTALADLGESRPADYLADVLGRTVGTRQRPAWASLEYWLPGLTPVSPQLGLIAVAAALLVTVAGLSLLSGGPRPDPVTGPSPTGVPASAAAIPEPTAAVPAAVALPAALRATWAADVDPIPGLGDHDSRLFLEMEGSAPMLRLTSSGSGDESLPGAPTAAVADELTFTTARSGGGCTAGDAGRYRWSVAGDRSTLTFDAIEDACATRRDVLVRTWHRSLDGRSEGGRGVIAAFDPPITVTLPEVPFSGASQGSDAIAIGSATGRSLGVIRDPVGLTDPCDYEHLRAAPLAQGIEPILTRIRSVPNVSITTDETTVDGRRLVAVNVETLAGACPQGHVELLASSRLLAGQVLTLHDGKSLRFYLLEGPGATFLVRYDGGGVSPEEEQAVIDSIAFLDSL